MTSPFDLSKPIAIGSNQAGLDYKEELISFLEGKGLRFHDFGIHPRENPNNNDFVAFVATAVEKKEASFGILIDSSANEVAIIANKYNGIRAAICWGEELAKLSRESNNANILCIPAFFVRKGDAETMLQIFVTTNYIVK